jgi:glycerophosphoryl diester phosphodiesterase
MCGKARPLVIAHRGASSEAPENTLAAFSRGLEIGADGFEFDVHMSKDGELVVIHDETVARTTSGSGWVRDMTLSELKALDAGSWFDLRFKGEKIPTLRQVLELIADRSKLINIELKSGIVIYPLIERKVIEVLGEFNVLDKAIISSFNHYSLRIVKEVESKVKTGILYMEGLVEPWIYARRVPADCLHPAFYLIMPEIVRSAHDAGMFVNVWTVDKADDMKKMVVSGVDAVITNCPGEMISLLKEEWPGEERG